MAKKRTRIRERLYDMEDALFYERSRTLAELFKRKISQFSAFDFNLDITFHDNWVAQVELCEAHPTDETANADLQIYTADADAARKTCFTATKGLQYYVEKAFPENLRIMQEFGFTERGKVRNQTLGSIVWLLVMKEIAANYNAELTAVDMPASILTDLGDAADDLSQKEIKQEVFKRVIIRYQRERIEKVNKLYGFYSRVHSAAQIVFYNNEEVRKQFNLQ